MRTRATTLISLLAIVPLGLGTAAAQEQHPNTPPAGTMMTAVLVAPKVPAKPAKPTEPLGEKLSWLSELWMSVPIVGEQIRGHQSLSRPR